MSFNMALGGLDYLPCRYGTSKIVFRGPRKDLQKDYIAFLGGSETYGQFVQDPFPERVEQALGFNCVNFGCSNAGIDVFALDPQLLEFATNARITVIQVMTAQNMSNRFYSVHPRRNDRFVSPSDLLQTIFRDVDFSQFNSNKQLIEALAETSEQRFFTVREELRSAWLARMRLLLRRIPGKTVLLWLSARSPDEAENAFGLDPWFVGRSELEALRGEVTDIVEVVISPKARAEGTSQMAFAELDKVAAEQMLNPAAHGEAAAALVPVLSGML